MNVGLAHVVENGLATLSTDKSWEIISQQEKKYISEIIKNSTELKIPVK